MYFLAAVVLVCGYDGDVDCIGYDLNWCTIGGGKSEV